MTNQKAPLIALPPCPMHQRADYKIRCAMIWARLMAVLTVLGIAAALAAGVLLLGGCGMLGSPDTWTTIGEGLARACAKCHTEGGALKALPGKGATGPAGHSMCPVECPVSVGRK